MQKILRYKKFKSNDDFVSWQVGDDNIRITQVVPVNSEIQVQIYGDYEGGGQIEESVFVVYFLDNESR